MHAHITSGLIAAPYSPLKPNGNINPDAIKDYADLLIRNGVKGAFICGSSGEGLSLTVEERKIIAEEWVKHASGNFKTMVHVGAGSIKDSQALAEHAASIGVDSIASIEPIYYLIPWMDDLSKFYKEISSAANGVPFYSYCIPGLTHYNTDYVAFLEKAITDIPDFKGVKYTNNNLYEYTQLVKRFGDKLDIMFGSDEMLINALASGAKGAVGSTYNFMPALYDGIIRYFENGNMDEARELQIISQNIISLMPKYNGSIVFGKAVMNLIGIECGPNRLPLKNLTDKQYKELEKDLKQNGFYDYYAK